MVVRGFLGHQSGYWSDECTSHIDAQPCPADHIQHRSFDKTHSSIAHSLTSRTSFSAYARHTVVLSGAARNTNIVRSDRARDTAHGPEPYGIQMTLSRRSFIHLAAASGAITASPFARSQVERGRFSPSWASLVENYRTPDWFRDAKFGIWAHWSAQCVPETGDWYARLMYLQGTREYDHHVRTYGHPCDVGFMEIENRWKAESWQPEELLALYKRAGARYFVSLANHHDNFDAYNSRHHEWNSTRIGPRRDIVGTWAKLARASGLRFGVSNHSAHSWHWYQPAYGYDAEGARAGQRYDAFRLRKQDGKGKWWEGLDPQNLYSGPNMVMPDGITTIQTANVWHESNDRVWDEKPPANNPAFARKWFLRCQDLIDSYQPDLVYFDNFDLPLGQIGLDIASYYYNASIAWHANLDAVLNIKMVPEERRAGVVEDVERGFRPQIEPLPWQTDTCLGDWHYNRSLFDNHRYKSAATVIHRLCDIVSKNGSLLLSVPLRADGTIDADERRILEDLARWMAGNGEAIFATRPWRAFGEGPTQIVGGMFGEDRNSAFSSRDVRFTCRDGVLFAIVMGYPASGIANITSLGQDSALAPGSIETVKLVSTKESLSFSRKRSGLSVQLPAGLAGEPAVALEVRGAGIG
jgi:alpha-L-fucosidase